MPEKNQDKSQIKQSLNQADNSIRINLPEGSQAQLEIKSEEKKTNLEQQREWAKKMQRIQRTARVGKYGAYATGHIKLARELGEVEEAMEEGEMPGIESTDSNLASNLAGRQASKIAGRRGAGGGKAAAIGGAVAGALQGEGVTDIGKTSFSWYRLWVAFVALFTLVGSIPALLYLDFHYIMSKGGSKWFSEMFIWQKIVLALANLLFLFVLIIALALISVIYCTLNPTACLLKNPDWLWEGLKIIGGVITS